MKKEYFEMLKEIDRQKIDITKLYILSCMSSETWEEDWAKMDYAYDCWIEADTDLDLARLADIVQEHWFDIQNDEITDTEIIDMTITY